MKVQNKSCNFNYYLLYLSQIENVYTTNNTLNFSCGLTNYWPIDENGDDIIGNSDMNLSPSYSFVNDKFAISQSALQFSGGLGKIQQGVYLNGDFSFSLWVYLQSCSNYDRILQFDSNADLIAFSICYNNQPVPGIFLMNNVDGTGLNWTPSSQAISKNQWYHLAFTLQVNTFKMYINGNPTLSTQTSYVPPNILRSGTFALPDQWTMAIFDEIKIYNKALTNAEISIEINQKVYFIKV